MSTDYDHSHRQPPGKKLQVLQDNRPITRTASILLQLDEDAGC